MHRRMIAVVDDALAAVNDPNWPRVEGWNPIPWSDNDPDWPVPDWQDDPPRWADPEEWKRYTRNVKSARSPKTTAEMQERAKNFVDANYLEQISLDGLGIAMENTILGWMHVRWSGLPPNDPNSAVPNNDWLFSSWSSHVNGIFWKLHGWIDDRIGNWEDATGKTADFSKAWIGPVNTPNRKIVLPAAVHRNLKAMDGK